MKYFIIAITIFAAIACTQAPVDNTVGNNVVAIEDLYAAFSEGDIEGVTASMSKDIIWNEAENFPYADGNPYIGPDAIVSGVFAPIGADWLYWNVSMENILPSGDYVVVLGRYVGKNAATEKEIDAQFVHVWRLEDGKIVTFQQYADTAQVLAAMQSESF